MSSEAIRTVTSVDRTSLVEKLMQKDRDLEVAAKLGQALLEQNKDLQQRTEFLEESLAKSSEEMVQLKHELDRKAELLRVYCHYDDDGFTCETMDDSLKKRFERIKLENVQLKHDVFSMRKEMENQIDRDRKRYEEVSRQFEQAQQQIAALHAQVIERGEDYAAQSVVVEKLLREISLKCCRERELTAENADLSRQVDEALQRQNELGTQMNELQERYTELRSMFCDAEEELSRFRSAPPKRAGSIDSLYDSLASELENSDSGFSCTPAASARAGEALNLRLELQRAAAGTIKPSSSKEEFDVPSSVLAEVARKRITIEPAAPPQTPQSEVMTPTEGSRASMRQVEVVRKLTCDASTSCTELAGPSLSPLTPLTPLAASTPKSKGVKEIESILQLSEPRSICCTPVRSSSTIFNRSFRSFRLSLHSPTTPGDRCSSEDPLENYVAPKMGEPGVPGTRDLNYSLRMLRARRKSSSCSSSIPLRVLPPISQPERSAPPHRGLHSVQNVKYAKTKDEWIGKSTIVGQDHQRMSNVCSGASPVGLEAHEPSSELSRVLYRSELNTSSSLPQRIGGLRSSSSLSVGLRSFTSSFSKSFDDTVSEKGILLRRF